MKHVHLAIKFPKQIAPIAGFADAVLFLSAKGSVRVLDGLYLKKKYRDLMSCVNDMHHLHEHRI